MTDYVKFEDERLTLDEVDMERLKTMLLSYINEYGLNKHINKRYSSYFLKHRCEDLLGKYVSNRDLKEAMKQLYIKNSTNLRYSFDDDNKYIYYPISKKMVDRMCEDFIALRTSEVM